MHTQHALFNSAEDPPAAPSLHPSFPQSSIFPVSFCWPLDTLQADPSLLPQACAKHSTEDAPLPIWVAFTLADIADGTLRSGESVTDA
eukprot:2310501-Rhodomonas_salina.1